jgi:hypothetical protein
MTAKAPSPIMLSAPVGREKNAPVTALFEGLFLLTVVTAWLNSGRLQGGYDEQGHPLGR